MSFCKFSASYTVVFNHKQCKQARNGISSQCHKKTRRVYWLEKVCDVQKCCMAVFMKLVTSHCRKKISAFIPLEKLLYHFKKKLEKHWSEKTFLKKSVKNPKGGPLEFEDFFATENPKVKRGTQIVF